jgi:hypothetical protein
VIAGMIGGALMGMVFVTHLALLLVFNPPRVLKERAVESNVSTLITMSAFVSFLGWNVFAIVMAFASQSLLSGDSSQLSIVPSPIYLFIVFFVTVFISIPAFIFFRDRKSHLLGEILGFIAIFGFLLPNLVVAIHRSNF